MEAIRVAIATEGRRPVLRDCLEALGREGAEPLVVASGVDPSLVAAALVLHEPRASAALARNRALAECGDDQVIAYIDDDSIVEPGWLASVAEAWAGAGPDVVAIAGRIRVRFENGRPPWLGDDLLTVFSELDHGPEPITLDPEADRFAYGPNMSFRAGALRAVGGFDPAYGHRDGRSWFGEEHEAQLALTRAGGRVRWWPGPGVEHVVPTPSLGQLLRRRFAYGCALGARGRRGRANALRHALPPFPGAMVAASRGEAQLAALRLARAAENTGVVVGRRG